MRSAGDVAACVTEEGAEMEITKYGQVFYAEEADALVAAGTILPCRMLTGEEHHHSHDPMDCDYCTVYHDGPNALEE